MKTLLAVTFLSIAAMTVGCSAASDAGEGSTEDTSADALTAAQKLVGTYESSGDDALSFYALTLSGNHRFKATGGCNPAGSGPHCFAISESSGTWKLVKSGPQLGAPAGVETIQTTDQFDQVDTYFYSLTGKKLELATSYRGDDNLFIKQ
jgi:hypothetical protein